MPLSLSPSAAPRCPRWPAPPFLPESAGPFLTATPATLPNFARSPQPRSSWLPRIMSRSAAFKAASLLRSWLKLTTSQKAAIDVVGAQDDSMAMGARKAFQELNESEQERWLKLPFTGCDGLPKTGQGWVRSGILAATVYVPPNSGQAIEMLVQALQQKKPLPERALTTAVSIPSLQELKSR